MPGIDQDFRDYPGNARALKPNDPPYDASRKKYDSLYPSGDRPTLPPATLRFSSNFNDGTIYPFTIKGTDSVVVDSINLFNGRNTLRGNLYTNPSDPFVDPITNKPSNNNPLNFNLSSLTSGASRTWAKSFYRYWLRFDDADNRDEDNNPTRMKLGYFSDTFNEETGTSITSTQSAIFPTVSPENQCGIVSYFRNGTESGRFDPTPTWPAGAIQTGAVNRGMAYNGNWNKVEVLCDRINNTFAIWINDIKVVANNTQREDLIAANGDMPVSPYFRDDQFSLFHADSRYWPNSTDRTGVRGGFNIADFQHWEGDPRPWGL